MTDGESVSDAIAVVVESARRMGVGIDEEDAARWLTAMAAEVQGGDIVVDVDTGAYGHRASMLDFDPAQLARFRDIGRIIGIPDRGEQVVTALAVSGSAAQGRIQVYPGDCDFFERVHIRAPTREEACRILADVLREKALESFVGPTHRLWEVKFGSYPSDGVRDGQAVRRGGPITWRPDEVRAGRLGFARADGSAATIKWDDAAEDPGWCKLDWIVADPARRQLANASNMLDVTWEAPDGVITALDGVIDPYFQEVYLEAESRPVFNRIVNELAADAVDEYVHQLEQEVYKYAVQHPNYGKVARRLYNIFRLTGRYAEAAYLRELFDEPASALYQVAALVRTIDEAATPGAEFAVETLLAQADQLIMSAVAGLEGPLEAQVVAHLLRVRDDILGLAAAGGREEDVRAVTAAATDVVNDYFEARLVAIPGIRDYLDRVRAGEPAGRGTGQQDGQDAAATG
jgi:hypothetical protein